MLHLSTSDKADLDRGFHQTVVGLRQLLALIHTNGCVDEPEEAVEAFQAMQELYGAASDNEDNKSRGSKSQGGGDEEMKVRWQLRCRARAHRHSRGFERVQGGGDIGGYESEDSTDALLRRIQEQNVKWKKVGVALLMPW